MRARLSAVAAIVVVGAVTIFLFAPLLLAPASGEDRHLGADVAESQWPDLVYLCGALHELEIPMWNPYQRGGYAYYADPRAGTFNPVNWVICGVGGSSPGYLWAEVKVVLAFFLAGLFGLLWLRRYDLPWSSALLGAVAIQTAPYMRESWELGQTAAVAYAPLMLWAAERAVTERRLRDAIVLALACGLCTWAGSPEGLFAALSLTVLFVIVRLAWTAKDEGWPTARSALTTILVAMVVGGALTAAVIVPPVLLASQTVAPGPLPAPEGALDPARVLGLVWRPESRGPFYLGMLLVALMPLAMIGSRWTRSANGIPSALPGRWFHLVVALVAAASAFGFLAPLLGLVPESLFGVPLQRLPLHVHAWLGPAVGALAAAGIGWLATDGINAILVRGKKIPLLVASAGLLVGGTLWDVYGTGHGPTTALLGVGIVGLASTTKRVGAGNVLVGCLLSALLLYDLAPHLPEEGGTREGPAPADVESDEALLRHLPETDEAWAYLDARAQPLNAGMRLGRRDLGGDRDPMRLEAKELVWGALAESPRLAEQLGVRYVVTDPPSRREPAAEAAEGDGAAEDASGEPANENDGGDDESEEATSAAENEPPADDGSSSEEGAGDDDASEGDGEDPPASDDAAADEGGHGPVDLRPASPFAAAYEAAVQAEGATRDPGTGVVELAEPLPVAYWISMARAEEAQELSEAVTRLAAEAPTKLALVQNADDAAKRLIAAGDAGATTDDISHFVEVEGFRMKRDRVELDVAAPDLGFVVVNGAWHPGWVGRVGDVAVPTYQINGLTRGLVVDVGEHHVRMEFRPTDGIYLRYALLGGLGLSLLVLLGAALRRG